MAIEQNVIYAEAASRTLNRCLSGREAASALKSPTAMPVPGFFPRYNRASGYEINNGSVARRKITLHELQHTGRSHNHPLHETSLREARELFRYRAGAAFMRIRFGSK